MGIYFEVSKRRYIKKFWKYRFLHCHSEIIGISNEATIKDFRKAAVNFMKGYFVTDGYMGLVDGVYRLFADESDYYEYMND